MSDFHPKSLAFPNIDFRNNLNSPAELFFEKLRDVIRKYEGELDDKHRLVWQIACLDGKQYDVHEVGYFNPALMRFKASDPDGGSCELLVHVASVQFVLRVQEVGPEEEKQQMGFRPPK